MCAHVHVGLSASHERIVLNFGSFAFAKIKFRETVFMKFFLGLGSGVSVYNLGFRILGIWGFRVFGFWGLGVGVIGLGFRFWGFGFKA